MIEIKILALHVRVFIFMYFCNSQNVADKLVQLQCLGLFVFKLLIAVTMVTLGC